jgi:hypothetical protein
MRIKKEVPGYLDEEVRLEAHDGALQIEQQHELMGSTNDSIYLEIEQIPALVESLISIHGSYTSWLKEVEG